MSQTYIAILTMVASQLLPKIGVELGNEAITTTISTIVLITGAIWALARRYQAGDVTVGGFRK